MMRNCKASGNRAGEGMPVQSMTAEGVTAGSLAAPKAGRSKVAFFRTWRMLHGRAAMITLMVAAVIVSLGAVTYAAGTPRVILLRGWFGVFSMGLDSVTDQLKAQGINAEVAGHLSWQNEVAEILRERSAGRTGPLILVGHSQGANNVIDMARALEAAHVTVDLLITLSPFMQNRVPLNVAKAINYFQAPGWGQPLEAEPGFRGKLINVNLADDPTITHIGIDKSTKIQTEIVREIAAVK
jgi:alpha-beta hydrolase superfamily lysophospholipase